MRAPHNPDNGKIYMQTKQKSPPHLLILIVDESSRNTRRTTTRHEGYAVITLDANLSDLEDGNSVCSLFKLIFLAFLNLFFLHISSCQQS